jgi:hypothetical protein
MCCGYQVGLLYITIIKRNDGLKFSPNSDFLQFISVIHACICLNVISSLHARGPKWIASVTQANLTSENTLLHTTTPKANLLHGDKIVFE